MSDYLKKLKEAVESGKPNEAIKAGFDQILHQADRIATDPDSLKNLEEKLENIQSEPARPLTLEEITILNEAAKEQQRKIDAFDENLKIQSAVLLLTTEIEKYQSLVVKFTDRLDVLNSDVQYSEKKKLIDQTIKEINPKEDLKKPIHV